MPLRLIPKVFHTVNVIFLLDKLLRMIDPVMFGFGNIKCIVRLETVRANNAVRFGEVDGNETQFVVEKVGGISIDPDQFSGGSGSDTSNEKIDQLFILGQCQTRALNSRARKHIRCCMVRNYLCQPHDFDTILTYDYDERMYARQIEPYAVYVGVGHSIRVDEVTKRISSNGGMDHAIVQTSEKFCLSGIYKRTIEQKDLAYYHDNAEIPNPKTPGLDSDIPFYLRKP